MSTEKNRPHTNKNESYSYRIRTIIIGLMLIVVIIYIALSTIDLLLKYIIITITIALFSVMCGMLYSKVVSQRHTEYESALDAFSFSHLFVPMVTVLIIYHILKQCMPSNDPLNLLTLSVLPIVFLIVIWEFIERGILRTEKHRMANLNERMRNSIGDVVLGIIGTAIAAFLITTTL